MERNGFHFNPRTQDEVQFILEYEKDLLRKDREIAELKKQLAVALRHDAKAVNGRNGRVGYERS